MRHLILTFAVMAWAIGSASAQQSGYDPFVLDSHTGRFQYVPIPYDPEPPGANYSPFRFNWHSGHWDYVPQPLEQDYTFCRRQDVAPSNRIDTRMELGGPANRATASPQPAPPLASVNVPPPNNPHLPRAAPATSPSTRPADSHSRREQQLARLRSLGRWDFDYIKGRWVFVLPGDR